MIQEIDRLVDQNRAGLEQIFAEKHNKLVAATEVFRQTLETCKNRGWDIDAQFWTTSGKAQ